MGENVRGNASEYIWGCARKISFPTKLSAQRSIDRMLKKGKFQPGQKEVYMCKHCLRYHVGSATYDRRKNLTDKSL